MNDALMFETVVVWCVYRYTHMGAKRRLIRHNRVGFVGCECWARPFHNTSVCVRVCVCECC